MKRWTTAFGLALASGTALPAAANLEITEVYIGLAGPDGTADWVELTNTGVTPLTYGANEVYYDDESASILDGGPLPAFSLAAGESVVVIPGVGPLDIATETAAFEAVWGAGINLLTTPGGGGLSQGGDAVFLLDNGGGTIDSFSYTELDALPLSFDPAATFDVNLGGGASVVGLGGAYESNEFFNDSIGTGPDYLITIIGSPGTTVPEPGTLATLGLGALALLRRRKA